MTGRPTGLNPARLLAGGRNQACKQHTKPKSALCHVKTKLCSLSWQHPICMSCHCECCCVCTVETSRCRHCLNHPRTHLCVTICPVIHIVLAMNVCDDGHCSKQSHKHARTRHQAVCQGQRSNAWVTFMGGWHSTSHSNRAMKPPNHSFTASACIAEACARMRGSEGMPRA